MTNDDKLRAARAGIRVIVSMCHGGINSKAAPDVYLLHDIIEAAEKALLETRPVKVADLAHEVQYVPEELIFGRKQAD